MEIYQGLNDAEVSVRLKRDGYNELPSQKPQGFLGILLEIIKEPMIFLLLACGIIYLLLGEPRDATMLLVSVFVVIGITFYQERKTENALEALKNLSSPRALVIRNGEQIRIPGREVVKDDIIILHEGDRIPADATVTSSSNLLLDESLLTGESLPVRKTVWDGTAKLTQPGGEDLPFVFSGTLVVQGTGVAKVTSTGAKTEMGKIGKSLQSITEEDTLLKKEIGRLVKLFGSVGVILCLLLVILYGVLKANWLTGFLSGLTLAMAMLPEEFPVVLLIFLTLGAWRMSKKQVLTRKNQAIETLGATTVLCVDKTGTLTLNKMKLTSVVSGADLIEIEKDTEQLPERYHSVLEYSMLASQHDPFDPLEKEINSKCDKYLAGSEHIHKDWELVKEYPLSKELLALSHIWRSPDSKCFVAAAKGAPEGIIDLCHMKDGEKEKLMSVVLELSKKGHRLLGVARATYDDTTLPKDQHDFDFEYVGLIGFVDPLRSTVPDAVKECHAAGIRVIMITGDYPGTAQFIATQAGLQNVENYITGPELKELSKDELRKRIKTANIFARVVPEQKLAIVEALKANGEIVAMTGDGVNDAPALKASHIGIAMGERGTDVARESADLVLLNDDFTSIVTAVKLGRQIYDNLQKAVSYIFSIHIPTAGVALFPVIFNLPTVLFPVHIAFLELIIDPACSTVYESEKPEADIMRRSPRNIKQPLFNKSHVLISLLQGLVMLAVVMIVFVLALVWGRNADQARSIAFITMVLSNLLLIVTNLSKDSALFKPKLHKNKALYWIAGTTISFLALVVTVPFLRELFHFAGLGLRDFGLVLGMGAFAYFWLELVKIVRPSTE